MEVQQALPSSFGEQVKTSRKRKRLTQQQLAQRLGVHPNTISSWELGSYLPATRGLVLELARHLSLDAPATRQLLEASLTALFPHWQVPLPRNPFFTGREEILEALYTQLGVNQAIALTQSSALHGLGGVGKTQIALEYAYRHVQEYSAIFWIEAESVERIVSSLLHIAEVLQLPVQQEADQQRIITAVQRWLGTHNQWLLIWDNLEDLELLQRFLPPAWQGAVLITTRCQALGTLAQGMDLLPMEQEEGLLFLLRRAKLLGIEAGSEQMQQFAQRLPSEYAAAEKLVAVMDGLPLALDQAGAYIEEIGCSFSGYLRRYEQQRHQLLDRRGAFARDHPQSVVTTLELACQHVAQRHPSALDLMRFCAFVAPDAIPEELLLEGAAHLGPEPGLAADPIQFDQAIAVLRNASLVQRQPEKQTLSLHRLVQAILLDSMTEAEQEQWTQRVTAALDAVFPEVPPAPEYVTWKQGEQLLSHALLCLHRAGATEQSLSFASLAYKVAQCLCERGWYVEAEQLLQRALHIREQILGPGHVKVASLLNNLAILYREQGKYTEADPLLQRALRIREQVLGPDHPEMATSLNLLGILYYWQGKYTEAEPLLQRALHIWKQALGAGDPEVARALNNLALLKIGQGKYAEAEPLLQRALRIREQVLGPDHPGPASAYILRNLAELYQIQGKYAEAELLYQRALYKLEQALGPDHLDMTSLLNNLAELYQMQGKYAEAEPLYQRALHILGQVLDSDHLDTTSLLKHPVELYQVQGKNAEAEPLYQHALHILGQVLDPDDHHVVETLNSLAVFFREQGKNAEAEALLQHTLSIWEQRLGQHHPKTAQTLHDLALLHQKQGNLSEATSLAERALSIRSQALGETHPKTAVSQALYAQLVQEQGGISEERVKERQKRLGNKRVLERTSLTAQETAGPSPPGEDPFQEFLDACCELHPRAWCRASDLWQAYERWAVERQERFPLSRRAFIAQLKAHGCRADRTNTARIWRGITIVKKEL